MPKPICHRLLAVLVKNIAKEKNGLQFCPAQDSPPGIDVNLGTCMAHQIFIPFIHVKKGSVVGRICSQAVP